MTVHQHVATVDNFREGAPYHSLLKVGFPVEHRSASENRDPGLQLSTIVENPVDNRGKTLVRFTSKFTPFSEEPSL